MIDTLYHPYFQPPERWLRTMLLFYDKVYSIVPERAKYIPNPGIAALRDKTDGAFVPLTPTKEDLELDEQHYRPLQDVLRELSGWDKARRRRVGVHYDRTHEGSHLRVKGFEIHSDKLTWALTEDLVRFELAERTADPDWLRVNPQAASLIISLLADKMVMNRPEIASTSSDRAPSFAVAAKCELERGRQWTTEATLASAILGIAVPADLAHLPMERYLEIRKRYEDKREAFRPPCTNCGYCTSSVVSRTRKIFMDRSHALLRHSIARCRSCAKDGSVGRYTGGLPSVLVASWRSLLRLLQSLIL